MTSKDKQRFDEAFTEMVDCEKRVEAPLSLIDAWSRQQFTQPEQESESPYHSAPIWQLALVMVMCLIGLGAFWWLHQPVPIQVAPKQATPRVGRAIPNKLPARRPSVARVAAIDKADKQRWRQMLAKRLRVSIVHCLESGRRDPFDRPKKSRFLYKVGTKRATLFLSVSTLPKSYLHQPKMRNCLVAALEAAVAPHRPLPWKGTFRYAVSYKAGYQVLFVDTSHEFFRSMRQIFRHCFHRVTPEPLVGTFLPSDRIEISMSLSPNGKNLLLVLMSRPVFRGFDNAERCLRRELKHRRFNGTPYLYKEAGRFLHDACILRWSLKIEPGAPVPVSVFFEKKLSFNKLLRRK